MHMCSRWRYLPRKSVRTIHRHSNIFFGLNFITFRREDPIAGYPITINDIFSRIYSYLFQYIQGNERV